MEKIFRRNLYRQIEPYIKGPEAIIVTGIRRCGKTWLLTDIFNGLPSSNKISLDLENPLSRKIFEELNYETVKTSLEKQGLDFSVQAYVFLDEIQWLKQIPSVVKYLSDHYRVKFFLTGSASFYLKDLFSESLSGRKFLFELFPLSFAEFLAFKESKLVLPKIREQMGEVVWKIFEPLWEEYFYFGGFPEVVLATNSAEKEKKLDDIFSSYFQKEILQLSDFRKNDKIRDFIVLLAENTGNLLNTERMANELKVSRITIEEWLSFLEATYLISLVPPFSSSARVAIRKAKKIYFIDWALVERIHKISFGQKWENCVFRLLKLRGDVSYYRKKSGAEMDFVLNKESGFEVKTSAVSSDIKQTRRLAVELKLGKNYVVSYRYGGLPSVVPGFAIDSL
ncbi:MAG: ATP-binding protein [bacterium]|nr:ATP-binding protein [bacterium]